MPRPPKFFFDFKRSVESMLRGSRRLSLRHFTDEFDYDEFLEGEGSVCATPRSLALTFAIRFLSTVPPEYAEALSVALVSYLS